MSATGLMNRILLAAAKLPGLRLFRNNVGLGWVGKPHHFKQAQQIWVHPGDVLVRNARPLHAGLFEGSADLIGWHPVTITPAMVGRTVAVFVSSEVKDGSGRADTAQKNWLRVVNENGGFALIARSEQDLLDGIARAVEDLERPRNGGE